VSFKAFVGGRRITSARNTHPVEEKKEEGGIIGR